MIVSKYFNTIDDFIHLELATPKAKGNMAKFHMNPILLDEWSRQFFTSLETLLIYNKEDDHFSGEQFYQRIYHYTIKWSLKWMMNKQSNEIYKCVVLNNQQSQRYGNCARRSHNHQRSLF